MMTFQQHESGVWVYPRSAWRKFAWRLSLLLPVTDESELTDVFHHFEKTSPMFTPFLRSWGIEENAKDFLSKRNRIVALRLDRRDGSLPLSPLHVDLWWVWLMLGGLGAAVATVLLR